MTETLPPNRGPTAPLQDDQTSWANRLPTDGSFDVASGAGWAAKRAMQLNPQIEPNFRATVRGLVGSNFTDGEIKALEGRALDQVQFDDLDAFHNIQAGVPVQLSPRQERRVRELFNRMGRDPLTQRARDAYEQGLKQGKIQVR